MRGRGRVRGTGLPLSDRLNQRSFHHTREACRRSDVCLLGSVSTLLAVLDYPILDKLSLGFLVRFSSLPPRHAPLHLCSQMTTSPQPALGDRKLDKLLTKKERKKLDELINQISNERSITAHALNSILSDLNLNEKRFYTILVLVVILELNYNITRTAANKKYEEHQIHLCLKCFSFFSSNKELALHLKTGNHIVSCGKIKAKYVNAQNEFKEI